MVSLFLSLVWAIRLTSYFVYSVRALNKRLGECALDMHGRHTAIALFSSAKLRREMRHVGQTRGQESLKPSDVALIDAVTRTARVRLFSFSCRQLEC
jgi:hypothetical protein